jgi:hypothetical protein
MAAICVVNVARDDDVLSCTGTRNLFWLVDARGVEVHQAKAHVGVGRIVDHRRHHALRDRHLVLRLTAVARPGTLRVACALVERLEQTVLGWVGLEVEAVTELAPRLAVVDVVTGRRWLDVHHRVLAGAVVDHPAGLNVLAGAVGVDVAARDAALVRAARVDRA